MLARCGGGDPGNMIIGWRFLVGLGCSTVNVGMMRSRGRGVFSSGVGGSISMTIAGGFKATTAVLVAVLVTWRPLVAGVGGENLKSGSLFNKSAPRFRPAMEVVAVSVGVVSTSLSIMTCVLPVCRSSTIFSLDKVYEKTTKNTTLERK